MVDVKDLKSARLIAIGHIVVGILLMVFGVVDRVEGYFWTGEGCFGIWCGVWVRKCNTIRSDSSRFRSLCRIGWRKAVS